MSSSLVLPRGMETLFPSPEISRYYNKANTRYINTTQVLSEVLSPVRYPGQTFLVGNEEWWFKYDVTDGDLVLKIDTAIPSLDDVTSQGSSTSVPIQSPNAVNADELVSLGQVQGLIGAIVVPNHSFEDVLQVNRTATTSPLIPNGTEPTGAVNLRQVEEMISEIPTPIIFTTDVSLYLDPITNELRANTGLSTERFEYTSGLQEFTLVDEPSFVISLMLNLVAINNPLTDYSIDGKKLTILKPLEATDKINITYQFIITT